MLRRGACWRLHTWINTLFMCSLCSIDSCYSLPWSKYGGVGLVYQLKQPVASVSYGMLVFLDSMMPCTNPSTPTMFSSLSLWVAELNREYWLSFDLVKNCRSLLEGNVTYSKTPIPPNIARALMEDLSHPCTWISVENNSSQPKFSSAPQYLPFFRWLQLCILDIFGKYTCMCGLL